MQDRTTEVCEGRLDGLAPRRRMLAGDQLSIAIVGLRAGAEADSGPVGLVVGHVVFDQARCQAEEHRQDSGSERVERPAMAGPSRPRKTAYDGDHVVRGVSGRLGDDEDAVHAALPISHRLALDRGYERGRLCENGAAGGFERQG